MPSIYGKLRHFIGQTNRWHLFYTALIFFNNFAYGISVTIINSTMLDIAHLYSVSMNTISNLAICISVGYLLGSLSGYAYSFLNRQLTIAVGVLLMAACTCLLPHYGYLWIAFAAMVLNGAGSGIWDSSVSIWLVEIWPTGNAAILQASLFMSGVGSIVAPLMIAPFVHGNANVTEDGETVTVELRKRDLTVPFAVEGILQSIVPIILILTFFLHRYQKLKPDASTGPSKSTFEEIPSSKEASTRISHRKVKLGLIGLCAAINMAAEMGYIIFSSAMWQSLEVSLSAPEAVRALSVFTATYTCGRLATAFISLKLAPDTVISYHLAVILGSMGLLFFGRNQPTLILVGNAFLGYGFSAMWPALFAFTEKHLRLTAKVCSLYAFLSGVLTLIMPLVAGQLFDETPIVVFAVEFAFVLTSCVLFTIAKFWIGCCK